MPAKAGSFDNEVLLVVQCEKTSLEKGQQIAGWITTFIFNYYEESVQTSSE